MLQPICGYVLDMVGLKFGFALFASRLVVASAWRTGWRTTGRCCSGCVGLLGFAEGSANPAGMKATSEWFPAQERGSPAASSTSGRRSGRCSRRPWSPGRSCPTTGRPRSCITGGLGLCGSCCGSRSINRRRHHRALSAAERDYIRSGQERHLEADGTRPSIGKIVRQRNFWGIALPRFLADPDVGHADVLAAALSDHRAALRSEADRALRLAAVPGRGSRLPVGRHNQHGAAEAVSVSV